MINAPTKSHLGCEKLLRLTLPGQSPPLRKVGAGTEVDMAQEGCFLAFSLACSASFSHAAQVHLHRDSPRHGRLRPSTSITDHDNSSSVASRSGDSERGEIVKDNHHTTHGAGGGCSVASEGRRQCGSEDHLEEFSVFVIFLIAVTKYLAEGALRREVGLLGLTV